MNEEHLEKKASKVFSLGGVRLYECPLSWLTQETQEVLRAVFLVEDSGQLLFPGSWSEQPYWFIEAYEIQKMEGARLLKEKGQ